MSTQVQGNDNFSHIVRTTDQWNDRAIVNTVIPRGCLCVELTPDKKTKIKIGEGDKFYRQLPYIDSIADLSNYYTKSEVDAIIAQLNYMDIASTDIYLSPGRLPMTGNKLGDVRFVKNKNSEINPFVYLWNGTRWIPFSTSNVDLSEYAKKSEVMPRLTLLEQKAHTHENKSVLDATTASYTIPEKSKLASLENYTEFEGTDGTSPGKKGLVPAPAVTDADKFLSSDGSWKTVSSGGTSYQAGDGIEFDTETDPVSIEVKIGQGLSIDASGALQADGGIEYVAGDGISIDQGEGTTDLTVLSWEQGSIDSTTGLDDDTVTAYIRSPEIAAGLTGSIGLTATDTNSNNFLFKIAFYDSNHDLISMTPNFLTYADMANKPLGTSYIRIVLTLDELTTIDENDLSYCELSYPIEAGKYVITNTGVAHIALNGDTLIALENGDVNDVLTFGSDFNVTDGTVQVAEWNRLILNVMP
jgi:hypothetical protein